ncbi:hypothetical protein H4R35_000689 [Dimargaris xerosporica]|nr:hypothetical protein H4R35_000689 [Dimargaris xerosporica]
MASGPPMAVSRPRVETLEAALAFPPPSPSWPNQSTASHNRQIEIEVEEEVPVAANPLVPEDVVKKYDQVMDEMKRIRGALGQRARRKRRMRVAALDDSDVSLDMESPAGAPLPACSPALGSTTALPLAAEPLASVHPLPEAAPAAQATAAMVGAKAINGSSPALAVGGSPTTRALPTSSSPAAHQKSPGFSVRRLKSTKAPPTNPTSSSSLSSSASAGSGFLTHLHSKLSRTPILGNRSPATPSLPEPVKEAAVRPSPRTPLPPLEMDESGAFIVHTARPSLLSPVYHTTTPAPGHTLPTLDLDDPSAFVAVSPVEAPDGWFRSQPGTPQLPLHTTKPQPLKVRNVADSDSQSSSSSLATSPVHTPIACQPPTSAVAPLPPSSFSSPPSPSPPLAPPSPRHFTTAKTSSMALPGSPPPPFTTQPTLARVIKRPSPLLCTPTPATSAIDLPSDPTSLPFSPVASVAKHSYAPSSRAAPVAINSTAEPPLTATLPISPFAQAYAPHPSPPPMALTSPPSQSLSVDSLSMESHISVSASTHPRHILRQAQRQVESQEQVQRHIAMTALVLPSPTTAPLPTSARQGWCPHNQELRGRVISQHSFGAGSSFGHHSFSYTPSYLGRPSFFGDDDNDTYAHYHGNEGWAHTSLSRHRSLRKRASDSALHRGHRLDQHHQGMKRLYRFRSVKETIASISAMPGHPVDPPLGRWRTRAPPTTPGQWQAPNALGLLPSPAPALLPSFMAAPVPTPRPLSSAATKGLVNSTNSLVTSPAAACLSAQPLDPMTSALSPSAVRRPPSTDCTTPLLATSASPSAPAMVRQPSLDLSPSISDALLLSQVQPPTSAEPTMTVPVADADKAPSTPLHAPAKIAVDLRPTVPPKPVVVVESMASPTKSSIDLDLEMAELDRELASMTSRLNSQSFIAPNTYSDGIDEFHGQDVLLPDAVSIIGRSSADEGRSTSPIVAMAVHTHEMPSFLSTSMDPLPSSLVVAADAEPHWQVNNTALDTAVGSSTATHADSLQLRLSPSMTACIQPNLAEPLQSLPSVRSVVEPLLRPSTAIDGHSAQSASPQSKPTVLPSAAHTARLEDPMTVQSTVLPLTRAVIPSVSVPTVLPPQVTQLPVATALPSPQATVHATLAPRGDSVPLPVARGSPAAPFTAPLPQSPTTLATQAVAADSRPANRLLVISPAATATRALRIDTRTRPTDQLPLASSPSDQGRTNLNDARPSACRSSQRAARELLQELESELSMELARLSSSTPRSATVSSNTLVPDVPPRPQWSGTVPHLLSQPATPLSPALSAQLPSNPQLHLPHTQFDSAGRVQITQNDLEDAGVCPPSNSQSSRAETAIKRHPSRESLEILATMEAFPFPPSMRSEHSTAQSSPLALPISATSTVSSTGPFSEPTVAQQRVRPSSQRSKESVIDALSSIMESLQHDMTTPVTPTQHQSMTLTQHESLSDQRLPSVAPEKLSPTVQEPIRQPCLPVPSAGSNNAAIASLDALLADLAPSVQAPADAVTTTPARAIDSGINSPTATVSSGEPSPKGRVVLPDKSHPNALLLSTVARHCHQHAIQPSRADETASQSPKRDLEARSPIEPAMPSGETNTHVNDAGYGSTAVTESKPVCFPVSPGLLAMPTTGTVDHFLRSPLPKMFGLPNHDAEQVDANPVPHGAPILQLMEHHPGTACTLDKSVPDPSISVRATDMNPFTATHGPTLSSVIDAPGKLGSKDEPRSMSSCLVTETHGQFQVTAASPNGVTDFSASVDTRLQNTMVQPDPMMEAHSEHGAQVRDSTGGTIDKILSPVAPSNGTSNGISGDVLPLLSRRCQGDSMDATASATQVPVTGNHAGETSFRSELITTEPCSNLAANHDPYDDPCPVTPRNLVPNGLTNAQLELALGFQQAPSSTVDGSLMDCHLKASLAEDMEHKELRCGEGKVRSLIGSTSNARSDLLASSPPVAPSDRLPTGVPAADQLVPPACHPPTFPLAIPVSSPSEAHRCHHKPYAASNGSTADPLQRLDTFPNVSQPVPAGSVERCSPALSVVPEPLPTLALHPSNLSSQSLATLTIDASSPAHLIPQDGSYSRPRELSPIVEGALKHEFSSSMVGAQPSFEANDFSEVTDSVLARQGCPSLHSLRSIQTSYSQTRTWSISSMELSPDSVSRRPYFSPLRAAFSPQTGEFPADTIPETHPDMVQTGLKTVTPYLQIPGNDAFQRETIPINPKSEPASFVDVAPPPTTPSPIDPRVAEPTGVVAFPRLAISEETSGLESESESSVDETDGPEEIVQFGLIPSPRYALQAGSGERVVSLQPARRVRLASFSGSQKSIPSTPRHDMMMVATAIEPPPGHAALAEQASPLSAGSEARAKLLTVPMVISPGRAADCHPLSRRSLAAVMATETPRSNNQARPEKITSARPIVQSPPDLQSAQGPPSGPVAAEVPASHPIAAIPTIAEVKIASVAQARSGHLPLLDNAVLPPDQLDEDALMRDDKNLLKSSENERAMASVATQLSTPLAAGILPTSANHALRPVTNLSPEPHHWQQQQPQRSLAPVNTQGAAAHPVTLPPLTQASAALSLPTPRRSDDGGERSDPATPSTMDLTHNPPIKHASVLSNVSPVSAHEDSWVADPLPQLSPATSPSRMSNEPPEHAAPDALSPPVSSQAVNSASPPGAQIASAPYPDTHARVLVDVNQASVKSVCSPNSSPKQPRPIKTRPPPVAVPPPPSSLSTHEPKPSKTVVSRTLAALSANVKSPKGEKPAGTAAFSPFEVRTLPRQSRLLLTPSPLPPALGARTASPRRSVLTPDRLSTISMGAWADMAQDQSFNAVLAYQWEQFNPRFSSVATSAGTESPPASPARFQHQQQPPLHAQRPTSHLAGDEFTEFESFMNFSFTADDLSSGARTPTAPLPRPPLQIHDVSDALKSSVTDSLQQLLGQTLPPLYTAAPSNDAPLPEKVAAQGLGTPVPGPAKEAKPVGAWSTLSNWWGRTPPPKTTDLATAKPPAQADAAIAQPNIQSVAKRSRRPPGTQLMGHSLCGRIMQAQADCPLYATGNWCKLWRSLRTRQIFLTSMEIPVNLDELNFYSVYSPAIRQLALSSPQSSISGSMVLPDHLYRQTRSFNDSPNVSRFGASRSFRPVPFQRNRSVPTALARTGARGTPSVCSSFVGGTSSEWSHHQSHASLAHPSTVGLRHTSTMRPEMGRSMTPSMSFNSSSVTALDVASIRKLCSEPQDALSYLSEQDLVYLVEHLQLTARAVQMQTEHYRSKADQLRAQIVTSQAMAEQLTVSKAAVATMHEAKTVPGPRRRIVVAPSSGNTPLSSPMSGAFSPGLTLRDQSPQLAQFPHRRHPSQDSIMVAAVLPNGVPMSPSTINQSLITAGLNPNSSTTHLATKQSFQSTRSREPNWRLEENWEQPGGPLQSPSTLSAASRASGSSSRSVNVVSRPAAKPMFATKHQIVYMAPAATAKAQP